MISSNVDPRLAASVAETKDLQRFKTEMGGLKQSLSGGGQDKMAELKKACQNFEAVFIGKLWEQMKQTVPKEGYLHSKQEESYMSMFDRDFSEKMASAGGIGLADMIYDQLSRKLKQASQETLSGGVSIKPLQPEPIALNRAPESVPLTRKGGTMTLEDWGGTEVSGGNRLPPAGSAPESGAAAGSGRLSDVEVQARLETLARRLEAERGQGAARPSRPQAGGGYKADGSDDPKFDIGRKFAEIG
ncbi:rod-binding protein [Pseudodesulfovibrio indicus]|uniref:rod-binding protein n=1 Tax=Pseudodesulfovibrio indicus TaxID=1716143 RepID=UPI00292FE791|nr:rod-binding protein [Pseudodesulfovibrio indicus]